MSESLTDSEHYALDYLYGVGTEDVEIECRSFAWVVTRFSHKCLSVIHKGPQTLPAKTRMVMERAKVEGRFGSCYTCEDCILKSRRELEERV
jgi:hypothetical protein